MKEFACLLVAAIMMLAASPAHADNSPFTGFPDRSSPDAMISTFMQATDEIVTRIEALELARSRSHSSLYPQPTRNELAQLNLLQEQAIESLDLSRIPEGIRTSQGIETALMLHEILHRAGYGKTDLKTSKVKDKLWAIVGTNLYIGLLEDGIHSGDHVFTSQTVANAPSLYENVISLKPQGEFNAYAYYIETPGGLVPPAWGGVVMNLPKMWRQVYFGNTLWQWSAFALCLSLVAFLPGALARVFSAGRKRHAIRASSTALLAAASGYFLTQEVNLTGLPEFAALIIFDFALFLSLALCVFMASEWLSRNLARVSKLDPANVDASMIRLFCRVLGISASIIVLAFGASRAGLPVLGIVAGLGVGGLAVALAAQPTIENLLAGIVLYLDGSVRVGEHIEATDVEGVIEQIGMRSTRLRSMDGSMISITNSDLAGRIVKNHSRRSAVLPVKKRRTQTTA